MALAQIEPVTYEVSVGTTGTALVPPAISITDIESAGVKKLNLYCTVPRWLKVGMAVRIAGATAIKFANNVARVSSIDGGLTYFTVEAPWITSDTVYDSPATGTVTATAQFHGQRMTIQNPSGSGVTLTIQSLSGAAYGYQPTLAAGAEKEIIAPHGAKFDAAEFYGRVSAGAQVMRVMLL